MRRARPAKWALGCPRKGQGQGREQQVGRRLHERQDFHDSMQTHTAAALIDEWRDQQDAAKKSDRATCPDLSKG